MTDLADYLDAYQTMTAQRAAPIAQRKSYTPLAPAPSTTASMRGQFLTPQTVPIPAPSMYQSPGFSPLPLMPIGPTAPPASSPPVVTPSDPGMPIPSTSSAPVYTPIPSPPAEQQKPDADPVAPSSGGEASGDSGSSSSGFGWLMVAVGGYLFYRGLKS